MPYEELRRLREVYDDLRRTIKHLIWASAIFACIISVIAISGVSLAWYALSKQVETSEQNIIALCREQNALKADLRTIALDLGIPAIRLTPLLPKPCTSERLQGIYNR